MQTIIDMKDNPNADNNSAYTNWENNKDPSELDDASTDNAAIDNAEIDKPQAENTVSYGNTSKTETTSGNGYTSKKVAGLPLNNSSAQPSSKQSSSKQTGTKAAGSSLQNRLAGQESANRSRSRRKKLLFYGFSTLALSLIVFYFYSQIKNLVAESHTGLRTPVRPVRLDSSARKIDSPAKSYEKEAKSRYQDSLQKAIEKDAMGHIVMDWSRLYDVNRLQSGNLYDQRTVNDTTSANNHTPQTTEDQSTDSQLTLAQLLKLEKTLADSTATTEHQNKTDLTRPAAQKGLIHRKAFGQSQTTDKVKKGSPALNTSNTITRANTSRANQSRLTAENSLFNVIRSPNSDLMYNGNSANGNRGSNRESYQTEPKEAETNKAETKIADMPIAEMVIVRAVVHGNHKVKPGSKVAFRLLEPVTFQGSLFEKNTILIGIATFRNGRVSFSDFRSKSLSSVSASQSAVASTPLPMVCYDTDMVAGIALSDQSPVETQTRQAGTSALSDAANDVSYSIPYGSLARAASSLTRGVANGRRQMREQFIDLADNYPVLLELMPPRQK
jgi:hypothetical protein